MRLQIKPCEDITQEPELGFDMDIVYFLSEINYMFTKAHGITYLREAIAMMFYKTKSICYPYNQNRVGESLPCSDGAPEHSLFRC